MTSDHAGRFVALQRTAAALLGGYAFTWGFSAILGFLVFLCAFLWAFAGRSLVRVWAVLAGGGLLMTGGASLVQHLLT